MTNLKLLIDHHPYVQAVHIEALFYQLSKQANKRKNVMIPGDIGCYTLGGAPH